MTDAVTYTSTTLVDTLVNALAGTEFDVNVVHDEVTLTVGDAGYLKTMQMLRDVLGFEQLIDLCGADYSEYSGQVVFERRYAAIVHLLSVGLNQRLRVRVFAADDEFPRVASVSQIWASASWYEREAFDLFGIVFDGHEDLRRILTDYGFIGHPFRKDFPLSGHVEMRYDADRKRVIYEPVTIESREITPRIVREANYGGLH
jgi:NADH-quinone oxidoreductase subunit C